MVAGRQNLKADWERGGESNSLTAGREKSHEARHIRKPGIFMDALLAIICACVLRSTSIWVCTTCKNACERLHILLYVRTCAPTLESKGVDAITLTFVSSLKMGY